MGLDKKDPVTLNIALEEIEDVLQDGARSAAIAMAEMNRVMANQPPVKIEPAPEEVARRIARGMTRKIDAALFAGRDPAGDPETATGYTDDAGWEEDEPVLTLEDVAAAVEEMLPKDPVPAAIWFVDRQWDYLALVALTAPADEPDIRQRMMGLHVVRWDSWAFDPETEIIAGRDDDLHELAQQHEDKHVWPWVCNHPGIWVRMSDGSWQQIEIVTGRTT